MDPIVVGLIIVVAVVVAAVVTWVVRRRPERGGRALGTTDVPVPGGPLRSRLGRTRGSLMLDMFRRDQLDAGFWEELEGALIAADVGVGTSADLVAAIRAAGPADGDAARHLLEDQIVDLLERSDRALALRSDPAVILTVGVNGTGKTTSIAKLAALLERQDRSVLLAAGDTFRAAAEDQLRLWASQVDVPVVGGGEGTDPASVAFEAVNEARATGRDTVIVDTAGRLHSKTNLMDELAKIARILRREAGEIDEVLLVLDGTTGQNGIAQARSFTEAAGVTGIIMTKLDGTARGGVAIAVETDLGIPVKFIGVGEGVDDLVSFEPRAFVEALLEP